MKSRTMPRSGPKGAAPSISHICCNDCGAQDANWASVNHGVVMCNDCASVHMQLGRHVSQVKHMHKSHWPPNLILMVQHLVSSGANSIWEHCLLDPAQVRSGKRKPNPNDVIHPTKWDFIKAKYMNSSYVHRMPNGEADISKQLHSLVRTSNLETSLRLLSHGAHTDYINPEKGDTPLHVAARYGQSLQVELLVVYGADPGVKDVNGRTAEDLARAQNHNELADRLVELQYELSDKIAAWACGDVPDHKSGRHYIVPKIKGPTRASQDGKKRLGGLSNQMFEVLAMDVYDEVERRELEKIWQEVQKNVVIISRGGSAPAQTEVVPFLPVHPEYSPTRNQGRQKLAHFKDAELNSLVCDLMSEIVRREQVFDSVTPCIPEEEPIYDMPPEEDYTPSRAHLESVARVDPTPPPVETVRKEEYEVLREELREKNAEILKLREQNRELSDKVTNLAKDNCKLKNQFKHIKGESKGNVQLPSLGIRNTVNIRSGDARASLTSVHSGGSVDRRNTIHVTPVVDDLLQAAGRETEAAESSRGSSEYDNPGVEDMAKSSAVDKAADDNPKAQKRSHSANTNGSNNKTPVDDSDPEDDVTAKDKLETAASGRSSAASVSPKSLAEPDELIWPDKSELKAKMDALTRMIQSLFLVARSKKSDLYLECAENILAAVSDVVGLFERPQHPNIKPTIQRLVGSAQKLKSRCRDNLEQTSPVTAGRPITDEIIAYAIEIATAEKQLVMMESKDEDAELGSAI